MIGFDSRSRIQYDYPRRRPKFRRLIGLAVILTILIFVAVNRQGLLRLRRLQQDQLKLESRIEALQTETTRLEGEQSSLQNDLTYIEQLARDKYRMVRRGEKVFRVIPPKSDDQGDIPSRK